MDKGSCPQYRNVKSGNFAGMEPNDALPRITRMEKKNAVLTLAISLAFAIAPALTSPFAGFTADQLPVPQIDPPIQPAGYAFAIWGLIYVWLVVSAIFGVLRRADDTTWSRARVPLMVSLAIGAPWLAIANASAIWATVTIFLMAGFAIAALIRAPEHDRWWFQAPVGIYAGWLTAASFVSLGSTAAGYGIITGGYGWAFIGIIGALIVAIAVFYRRPQAPEYPLTVVWALVGIIVANTTLLPLVSATAAGGIVALALLISRWSRPSAVPAS
jgi:MFS family permease